MSSVVSRTLIAVGTVAALAGASAHAADVHWSVGIQAPIAPGVSVGTVITDRPYAPVVVAPVYLPPPVYAPPPPMYAPAPAAYVLPPPVYVPAPVVYAPPRVAYGYGPVWARPVWVDGRWAHHPRPRYDHGGRAPLPVYRPGRDIRY